MTDAMLPRREGLHRRASRLEAFTISWNLVEARGGTVMFGSAVHSPKGNA